MTVRTLLLSLAAATSLVALASQKQNGNFSANLPEKEIRDLSYAIKASDSYWEDKHKVLQAVEDSLFMASTPSEHFHIAVRLAQIFRPLNTDSALYYAQKAREFAAPIGEPERQLATLSVIDALSTAGLFTEASRQLDSIKAMPMSPQVKISYWLAGRRLYGYMSDYAMGNSECHALYLARYHAYDDSLLLHLPAGSDFRDFIQCERLVNHGHYHLAQERLENLMKRLPQESNIYGMAAFQLAKVWRNLGNEDKYAASLAVSALSDVMGCVTEGMALPTLAQWLYEKGELSKAFGFINFAMEQATEGHARMRAVTIAHLVPIIDEAYQEKINSSRDELMVYFLLLILLLIATVTLIVVLYRQSKKSRNTAAKLAETGRRQESYIGNFMGLYSSYADKFNHLLKTVSVKLAAGQTTELKKLVDSGKFADHDNDEIYKMFDTAFLDIHPDFVDQINTLLLPKERITVKTPNTLTTELRIYAFVKLGIEESTRIAHILHYSTNTVYTYRNKMRNKAISRDTFDRDVALLGDNI